MSKKMYKKGRVVVDMIDFAALLQQDARFIKDERGGLSYGTDDYYKRHPRALQAQTASFLRSQQYWVVDRLISKHYLFVAEKIVPEAKEQ